jgi:hypothetical protein
MRNPNAACEPGGGAPQLYASARFGAGGSHLFTEKLQRNHPVLTKYKIERDV